MAWATPRDWVAGEIVTAAIMNTSVRDNLRYLKGLDGDITFSDDVITAFTIDGVDVSTHATGSAKAQHTAGIGDHTHQSTGAEAGTLDHGLALTGLTDDDHTQYVLRNIMTATGDIFQRGTSVIERLGIGTTDYFLKSDGTSCLWAPWIWPQSTPGDNLEFEANTVRSTTGDPGVNYAKVKEIRLPRAGEYRIKFDILTSDSGNAAYGRVYKDGSAIGTEQTSTSVSYVTKSEDISGWTISSLCQLYIKISAAAGTCQIRNFQILGEYPMDGSVITN